MARKRKRNTKKNPDISQMLMSKGAYAVYGLALGFAARDMIGDSFVGEILDDTLGKLFGNDDEDAAVAAVDGTYFGAIGMGAVHDPYGAIGMGAVSDPYGAVSDPYGAVGMHSNPHNLQAEWAARNTIHSAMSRGGIV